MAKPEHCSFMINIFDEVPCIFIKDNEEPGNDDLRTVDHPEFDKTWENLAENSFQVTDESMSLEDARKWCLDIGMTEEETIQLND